MSKINLDKAKGCKHCPGERPVYRNCINCGKPICYECVIEDAISQKVTGRSFGAGFGSSGDSGVGAVGSSTSTSMSYVTFCPACYLKNISDPSYMILTGSSFKRNSKISPHKKPKFFGDIVNVLMVFPLSLVTYYITLVIRIMTYRSEKQSYERYIESKQKAERALGIMPIAITEEDRFSVNKNLTPDLESYKVEHYQEQSLVKKIPDSSLPLKKESNTTLQVLGIIGLVIGVLSLAILSWIGGNMVINIIYLVICIVGLSLSLFSMKEKKTIGIIGLVLCSLGGLIQIVSLIRMIIALVILS